MIETLVNAEQYDKVLETVERFRCRRLLDLILTKDFYKNGEVAEDIRKIESINPKPSNVLVKLTDGTTTEISLSDFNASRKQQKQGLYKQWQYKMEGMLKEIADRLQINQLIEKLTIRRV